MKRVVLASVISTLAAIAWGIALRGDVAYGGEMIIPALAVTYAVIKEGERT